MQSQQRQQHQAVAPSESMIQDMNSEQHHVENQMESQHQARQQPTRQQFSCVYTKHLTQKRKIWHDGRLLVSQCRAILHAANPVVGAGDPVLDDIEISTHQFKSILNQQETHLQSEKHIIEIQGTWISTTTQKVTALAASGSLLRPLVSCGMKKVLGKKFQKVTVGACVPPQRYDAQQQHPTWRKRSRPLQPGELHQRHYGTQQHPHPESSNTSAPGYSRPPLVTTQNVSDRHPPQPFRNPSPTRYCHAQNPYQSKPHLSGGIQPQQALLTMPKSTPTDKCHGGSLNPVDPRHSQQCNELADPAQASRNSHQILRGCVEGKENGNPFAANAFNANSFYGEEADDDVDNAQGGAPDPFRWDDASQSHDEEDAMFHRPVANRHEEPLAATQSLNTPSPSKCAGSRSLSTRELLQLFGAGSSSVIASPDGRDPCQCPSPPEDDVPEPDAPTGGFQFALPPASDSSSDEDQ